MFFGDIMLEPWAYAKPLNVDFLHPMKMNIYVPGFSEGAGIITNYPDVAVTLRNQV